MSEIITTLHPENDNEVDLYPNIKKENVPNKSIDFNRLDSDVQNLINSMNQLRPSGTDTSTNILAFTQNKGIYIATDNGHWYYWNGTQYADGGAYQASVIADGSITYSKLASDVTDVFDEIEDELELQTSYLRTLLKSFCKNENLFDYQISANGSITATITDNTKADFLTIINSTEIKFKIPQGELRFFTFAKSDDKFYCWQLRGYGASVAPDNIATFTTNKVRVGYKVNPISAFIPSEDGFYKVKIDKYANTISVYYNNVLLGSITENSLNLELGFMLNVANVVKECSCAVTLAQNVKHLDDVVNTLMPTNSKVVDLIMCMGQSNMGGRGDVLSAPLVIDGESYEFRAVSDPTKLYPIIAPVGVNENQTYIDDSNLKTGGLIPAMCKEYYAITKTPLVVVSASKGGTNIAFWCANNNVKNEYIGRFNTAKTWLENNGYTIRHKYCIFCQGESNGDIGTTKEQYKTWLNDFCYYRMNQDLGMDMTFIISIGQYNGSDTTIQNNYVTIQEAQKEYCDVSQYATLVSTMFKGMKSRNLMKDEYHYYQEAYNEVGRESGNNMACYTINNN